MAVHIDARQAPAPPAHVRLGGVLPELGGLQTRHWDDLPHWAALPAQDD
jgi:hypothetical protein